LLIAAVNWAAVTAIATSVLAIGLLGGFAAAVFAARQAREVPRSREAQMAAEFFRRWNEDALVEARRLVARFKSPDELRDAFAGYVADDAPEAYVLYRELDYFEQLAALERIGAFDLELIKLLLGRTLVERGRCGDLQSSRRTGLGSIRCLRVWSRSCGVSSTVEDLSRTVDRRPRGSEIGSRLRNRETVAKGAVGAVPSQAGRPWPLRICWHDQAKPGPRRVPADGRSRRIAGFGPARGRTLHPTRGLGG
jgi:hypothetical protein